MKNVVNDPQKVTRILATATPLLANKGLLKPKPMILPQRQVFLRGLSSTTSVTNKTFI